MSDKPFAARPPRADTWVRSPGGLPDATPFTAPLTIDVTPASRARIKIVAFGRGQTVADMLRELFDREYPETSS